jgi:hypothetical protein
MKKGFTLAAAVLLAFTVACSRPKQPDKGADSGKPKRGKQTLDTIEARGNIPKDIQDRLNIINEADIGGRAANGPKQGEEAPDFQLQPLKFYEFKIDEQDITQANAGELYKPVKLSAFRDKKPVVLIFGSYT